MTKRYSISGVKVSKNLWQAIKLADRPAYAIAHESGLSASMLTTLICGIERIKKDDPRIIRVGKTLGIPARDCFSLEEE